MKITRLLKFAVAITILISIVPDVFATQYTAYSLKIAQKRIEQAGVNWRQKEPNVVNLAGINKVEGFVFDRATGELILVGQKEQGRAALTVDDLVVALRARFRYNEWPLVSIDPTPDTEKTQMQHIRFEGGIQDTAFGQAMFDADYRLKEMGMGLQSPGVEGLRTYWDRSVEEIDSGTVAGERSVNSRFWFYPINPHVVVREGVCVVRGLKVGVFTEVMAAKIDGNPVEDLKGFKDETGDAFANDVSRNFEDLCAEHPSFNSLRGLQELVAVSKALEELEQRPDLLYWLDKYPLLGNQTPKETKVLYRKYNGQRGICEVSGGVHLTALAMRLNAGDVTALREAVLKVRPSSNDLSWTFLSAEWLIPIGSGQVKTEDIVPLFSQAVFLDEHARYEQAIALLDEIIKVKPDYAEPWYRKGKALGKLGKVDDAIKCYDAAIECYNKILQVNPRLAEAYYRRGRAYCEIDMYGQAMADFGKAIEFNPSLSEMFKEQGIACGLLVWADNTPVTAGRVKIVDKIDVYRSGLGGFAVQQIGISRDAKVWDSTIGRNGYYSCRSLPEGKYYLFFNIPDAYIDRSKFHSYDKNWFYIREPEPSGIMVYHIAGHMYKPDEFNVKGSPVCVIPTIELTRRLDLIAPLQVGMKDGVYRFAWQKSNKAGSSRIIIEHMVYDNIQHPVYKEHELVGYSYLIPDETPLYPGRHRFRVQMITPTLRVYADSGWQEFVVPGKVLGLWIEEDKTDPTRRTIKWSGSEEIKSVRISSDDGSLIMTSADQSVRLPIVREERRLQFQSLGADGKEMVPGWKKWFQQPITVENQIK